MLYVYVDLVLCKAEIYILTFTQGFYGTKLAMHCQLQHIVYQLVKFPEGVPIGPDQVRLLLL